ncbi:unnamed protein product [Pylaiella littoralis]
MGYLQDGLKETMPKRDFKNHGWGVDPKAKGREAEELTGSNCVSWLSEHSYIGTDRKAKTLTCDCNPDLPPPPHVQIVRLQREEMLARLRLQGSVQPTPCDRGRT